MGDSSEMTERKRMNDQYTNNIQYDNIDNDINIKQYKQLYIVLYIVLTHINIINMERTKHILDIHFFETAHDFAYESGDLSWRE